MRTVPKNKIFSILMLGIFFCSIWAMFNIDTAIASPICECAGVCKVGTDEAACVASGVGCVFTNTEISECPPEEEVGPPAPSAPVLPDPQVVKLDNPLKGDVTEAAVLIGMVIRAGLSIVGALSLTVFVLGGFIWLTSAGNQEKVDKGAKTMLWATLGLVVVFASYMLVSQLFKF